MISANIGEKPLYLTNKNLNSNIYTATVVVPADFVDIIYHQASVAQQENVEAQGFKKGTVPLEYIQKNYRATLLEHVKEFLFNYFVVSFLHKELRENKVLMAGEPRLTAIHAEPHEDASFTFEVDTFVSIDVQEWRYLPFKPSKRKRYKDLDRQVDMFVDEEKTKLKKHNSSCIEVGDWVNFEITLLDKNECSLLGPHKENLWLKMGDEEIDKPLRELFLGKNSNETFCTASNELQTFFSDHISIQYTFCITVLDIVRNAYFCPELFKRCFRIKTNKDMYKKTYRSVFLSQ